MPKWMTVAFALFLSLQVFSTKGETVDEVINKYAKAMGGQDMLSSIKNIYAEGCIRIENDGVNVEIRDTLSIKNIPWVLGNDLTIATSSNNLQVSAKTGTYFHGWLKKDTLSLESELDFAGPLINYNMKGHSAELLGKEHLNGKDCYKVKLILKSGLVIHYFIDAKSWYVIREVRKGVRGNNLATGNNSEFIIEYSDYRKTTAGYIFPFKEFVSQGETTITFREFTVNNSSEKTTKY